MAQAHYFRKGKSLFSTTLVTGIGTGTSDTITLSSVAGLPTDTEITLTFDRVDQTGAALPAANMERITGIIVDSNFTAYTRAVEGTERAHLSGCVIEYIPCEQDQNDLIDGLLVEHLQTGRHSLTSPKVTTSINDSNGNEIIKTPATASAVNEITVANAATGNAPVISATGDDDKIPLGLTGKAAFVKATGIYDCGTVGATETVSWKNGDRQKLTLDENLTITFGDAVAGQTLTLYLLQDGSGTNTITWADTIVWQDGITWGTSYYTKTANKMNIAVIFYDGAAYYGMISKFA